MKKSTRVLAALSAVAASGSIIAAPLASFAIDNTATITVNINETISLKINDSTEGITSTLTMNNNELKEDTIHTLNVATNNPNGYTLSVIDQDTDNSLKRDASSNIPAVSGNSLVAATAGWGYKVKTPAASEYEANYHAVPISTATPAVLYTNDGTGITSASFNENTYVQIGVATGDVPSGSYTDTIVYRALGAV